MADDNFVPHHPALTMHDAIVITGSRDIGRTTARTAFAAHLTAWCGQGHIWLAGGAIGIDCWALEWLHERGENAWAVVPFTAARQPASAQGALRLARQVIELNLSDGKPAYLRRNYCMVAHAAVVVGFWSGKPGGTSATLRYAEKLGKETYRHLLPGGTR